MKVFSASMSNVLILEMQKFPRVRLFVD